MKSEVSSHLPTSVATVTVNLILVYKILYSSLNLRLNSDRKVGFFFSPQRELNESS